MSAYYVDTKHAVGGSRRQSRATAGSRAIDQRPRARRLGLGREIPYAAHLGTILVLAIWSLGSLTGFIDQRTLSAPWTVATTAVDLIIDGRLQSNLTTSAIRVALGLAFGIGIGTALAVVSGLSRWGEAIIDGPIQIKRAIPTLALIPLLILWFGIGEPMKVTVITLSVIIPIYLQTHNGLRGIDNRYVELAETLRMGHGEFIRHVVLPGALPAFLLGLRYAVTAALLSLVVVEQVNATSGLGYMIELARTYGQTSTILVGLVVYALIGLLSDGLVHIIQKRALSWRRTLAD
ncbi:MAG: transporter permease [Hyphomicrobiales bacterium]|nr:transporter permease [Hyphomicrobiales bacterium]